MKNTGGGKLFLGPCDFLAAATASDQFPTGKIPEIAFWGRSNTGKSSLINALVDRKAMARTSKTPGRTQQIIFFNIGDCLMLADLPGYGHAKAPREEQDKWLEMIHHYLQTRPSLRCVCLLIDSRHGFLANDLAMMQVLDRIGISYQVILTKIDLVRPADRAGKVRQLAAALERHPAARPEVVAVSAEDRIHIEELRTLLAAFADKKAR